MSAVDGDRIVKLAASVRATGGAGRSGIIISASRPVSVRPGGRASRSMLVGLSLVSDRSVRRISRFLSGLLTRRGCRKQERSGIGCIIR